MLLAKYPDPQSALQALFNKFNDPEQDKQAYPSSQVAQVEAQVKHLPSLKYLPSIHPGWQVVPLIKNPSLHDPH